jgi:hypothetical protein
MLTLEAVGLSETCVTIYQVHGAVSQETFVKFSGTSHKSEALI